jgi:predicted NBD/HSP70 family sugar kinase
VSEKCVIGADVGGTRLRVRAQDSTSGQRSDVLEIPVPRDTDALVAAITELAAQAADGRVIESVAAGLPGHVRDQYCVWIPNLRYLDDVMLGELLSDSIGAPCHLINDAQATLLAETREGVAQEHPNAVLVAVGTGIGGAIQINHELVLGANGCAGSFGWLPFSGERRDVDHGQWERTASGQALDSLAQKFGGTHALVSAARRGNPDAIGMLNNYGALLGEGIAGLASILDPNVVILAGGLVGAFDLFGAALTAAVAHHGSPTGRTVPVIPAALGSAAGVIGTLLWATYCLTEGAR